MVNFVSPKVSVTVVDQSFYIPGLQSSIPLIIIATQDQKILSDGSQALGTFEHGVVRTVTSISQSVQLYGIPNYLVDATGNPQHGDCRNEYGLDALNKALQILNQAYVIRANVNLNDTFSSILTLWNSETSESASTLNSLVKQYIQQYNTANGLVPADNSYKQTVTQAELTTLMSDALAATFDSYSFSSVNFYNDFVQDHTVEYPGFQDVVYSSTSGYITTADPTGLQNDNTVYGFAMNLISIEGSGSFQIQVQGKNCQTFGALIAQLQTAIQSASSSNTTVTLVQGRIRITSDLLGSTSSVSIVSDGYTGVNPLFANTHLFASFATPVSGKGIQSLNMYNNDYTIVNGSFNGLNAMINNWNSGSIISNQFTAQEAQTLLTTAATDFATTKEFVNDTALGANDAARRSAIVKQLNAVINDPNSGLTAENLNYNMVVCPGFPEVTAAMTALSQSLQEEVFVIGETPFDKPPTGPNSIVEWASTTNKVSSYDVAYYYPHALTSNLDGATILTSAASLALRVFAFNDQQGEVWFAPAGVKRGVVPEATSIGYVTGTLGTATTFTVDNIDQGDRDALYADGIQINPITFIMGNGVLVFGQKTTYGVSSALNRVNVSRLVKYIKRNLRQGLFPFLFEPDDDITWADAQATVNSFLSTLVGRRALYDFASIIDSTDNTPDTIDNSEMVVNIAIKPTKAVEFIDCTVTVVNTGANLTGTTSTSPTV